jgi:TP901 family phage tail tape measure protein
VAGSTREVFLLLKARDEASRVLRGFSAQIARSSNEMTAAALRQQAIATQQEVVERRRRSAIMSQLIAERQLKAAEIDRQIAQAKGTNASQAWLDARRAAARTLRQEAQELTLQQRVYDKQTATLVANIRQWDRQSSEMERAERQTRSLASAVSSAGMGVMTFGAGMIAVGAVSLDFFYDSFKGWMEYQKQVTLTQTQVDGFSASVDQLGEIGLRIANEIPVAFEQIQPALFDIFSSTDANLRQSEILLEGFSKAAVAGQTDIQIAARGTMAIMNAYNKPLEDVNQVLDVQFELVRKGVGSYADFAKVFGRVVPSATRAGQSFETVAAMLAYMTRNGQSAAMASTAAARALDAFSHPKSVKNMEKLGIKMRDAKGNLLPLVGILDQLRTKLLKMPTAERVGAILDIFKGSGGTIQARRFIEQVLLRPGELEDFKSQLAAMESASGVMQDKYSEMADTAAGKTQLMSNRWETLKIKIGEAVSPYMLRAIDALSSMVAWFNRLDPKTRNTIVVIGLLAAAMFVLTGIAVVVAGGLIMIGAAMLAVTTPMLIAAVVIAAVAAAIIALGVACATMWRDSADFRGFWTDTLDDIQEFRDDMTEVGDKIKEGWDEKIKPSLDGIWKIIDEKVMPKIREFRTLVVDEVQPKVTEAFRIIGDIIVWVFTMVGWLLNTIVIPALKDAIKYWDENKEHIEPFLPIIGFLIKAFLILIFVMGTLLVAVIVGPILAAWVLIIGIMRIVMAVVTELKRLFTEALKAFGKWIDEIINGKNTIVNTFTTMITDAKSWGRNIIQSLIDGVKEKLGPLASIMNVVAGTIDDFMQHSPAKRGPLSGRGYTYYAGLSVASSLAAGIVAATPLVASAVGNMVGAASPSAMFSAPVGMGSSTGTALMETNARGAVNITIHTNDIDPRTTAAELGWEIDGRLN